MAEFFAYSFDKETKPALPKEEGTADDLQKPDKPATDELILRPLSRITGIRVSGDTELIVFFDAGCPIGITCEGHAAQVAGSIMTGIVTSPPAKKGSRTITSVREMHGMGNDY